MVMQSLSRIGRGAVRRGSAAVGALRGRIPPQSPPWEPSAERRHGWWDLLPFTTHRIPLAGGYETAVDGANPFEDVRIDIVIEACGGSLDGRTVVDLGCLEGGFSLALAEQGAAHVVGIEARRISVERCRLAAGLRGTPNVEFVEADIKDELARRDPFDVVLATGILYHVSDPAAMLRDMRSACRGVAVIDTHVAAADAATHGCSELVERTLDGGTYRGRMFAEYAPDSSLDERAELLWAAWSDADSFWPLEDDLVRMIHDAGFESVEKIEFDADRRQRWRVDQVNRVTYVARVTS